jgi:hypothetical protein
MRQRSNSPRSDCDRLFGLWRICRYHVRGRAASAKLGVEHRNRKDRNFLNSHHIAFPPNAIAPTAPTQQLSSDYLRQILWTLKNLSQPRLSPRRISEPERRAERIATSRIISVSSTTTRSPYRSDHFPSTYDIFFGLWRI